MGGFAHVTGEGGISPYHREHGGDLIWQIGTGYFGCRRDDGTFDAEPRFLMSAHGFSAAVNSGGWHLILHLRKHHQAAVRDGREEHQVELYDLRAQGEPGRDVSDAHPDRARKLRDLLVQWLRDGDERGLSANTDVTPLEAERLRELGYVTAEDVQSSADWIDEDCPCERCAEYR